MAPKFKHRFAFVYPGKSKVGMALVVTEDYAVTAFAVGSIDGSKVEGIMSEFKPDYLCYSVDRVEKGGRAIPFGSTKPKLLAVRRGWFESDLPRMDGAGKFGNYCFRMAFHQLFLYHKFSWKLSKVELLDRDWVVAHSPPRILK